MEQDKRTLYAVVAAVAAVGVLFGCMAGALAGGAAGWLVSHRQAACVRTVIESESAVAVPAPDEVPALPGEGLRGSMMGATIVDVIAGTPADEAGLRPGDVILSVDGRPITPRRPLPDVIAGYEPGDRVTLGYTRGAGEDSVQVKLAAHPDDPDTAYLGVRAQAGSGPLTDEPED